MQRDLEGIFVVSVEQAVAAPYASERLADAGARVIKVERPEGDFARSYDGFVKGESAYFVWLNRGKESIRLDLQKPEDRSVLFAMIAKADVFIQNLAPGVIGKLGFELEKLRQHYPALITCSISGYGDEGPYRNLKAYDLLVQAETGLAQITGNVHGRARVGVSVCDIAAGMTAFQAILQALFARQRSGKGRHIAVSLFHALADWMNVPYLQFEYGGHKPARSGLNHPTIAPYGAYLCGDTKAVLFSIQNEREWESFCRHVLARPELAKDPNFESNPARLMNREALDKIIADVLEALTRDEVVQRLELGRIAYGRVSSIEDFVAHAQNRFITVATPVGPIKMLAPGAVHNGESLVADRTPAPGEHEHAIRREFDSEITLGTTID